jgi:hypothetical protein
MPPTRCGHSTGQGLVPADSPWGSARGWLRCELQRVKFEGSLEIPIVGSKDFRFQQWDLKGLEQSPVLNVVPVLWMIVDSRKPPLKTIRDTDCVRIREAVS